MGKYLSLNDTYYRYMLDVSFRDTDLLRRLREETATLERAIYQIPPEQGAFFSLLIKTMRAKRALEIGVFTGYSALVVAQSLPDEGTLIACDVNTEWTGIARRYWQEAGVSHKIDLRIAPALQTLDSLIQTPVEPFDFAFIDADKINTQAYFERCLSLLHPGGLIAVDNAFMDGRVIYPAQWDEGVAAMDQFLRTVKDDERVEVSLVPIGDGVLLASKR
ncbi:MAG: class I SAM-dependent methyltransferase [Anaerolinea sp.]|nr:class I SAM-dependent methyltransferase [Anaerolinea sp.]